MSDDDSWDPDAGLQDEEDASDDNKRIEVKDEDVDASKDDDHEDGESLLRSFYEEAATTKMAGIPPSSPSLSQQQSQEQLSERSHLSLAELSRMEDTYLSQTSHHEEEEERQRQKLIKRDERARGIRATKIRPPTEIQIKAQKEYQRFKYKKRTDLSDERDVGGSMEYLMRSKMGERDERRRLRATGKERERERERVAAEEAMSALDDDEDDWKATASKTAEDIDAEGSSENRGINWDFLKEGYVTMPRNDAAKLPYYVYRNSKRKIDAIGEGEIPSDSGGSSRGAKRRNTGGHLMFFEKKMSSNTEASSRRGKLKNSTGNTSLMNDRCNTSQQSQHRKCKFSIDEPDNVARSFPLCFHQLKSRMDLHGMIDTATLGSERMVVTHGRNAKRLWTRMVAGGITNKDHLDSHAKEDMGDKGNDEQDSMSNVSSSSSSSKSSEHSYQPTGVYSQLTYGTTSVIGTDNAIVDTNTAEKEMEHNPVLRLMALVHALPKLTHRHRLLTTVAQELGANRRAWENELRPRIEAAGEERVGDSSAARIAAAAEIRAIGSVLGVDDSVSSLPSWACDPSMPTHPLVLKQRVHEMRSSLVGHFRRQIWTRGEKAAEGMPASGDFVETGKEGTNVGSIGGQDADAVVKTEKRVDDVTVKDKASNIDSLVEESNNVKEDPHSEQRGEDRDFDQKDMDHTPAAVAESGKLLESLIDVIRKNTKPGDVDRYAKAIHESNVDMSNIDVALASFLDELTWSKARLMKMQQVDSSHFQHLHALNLAQENVGHWHESIISYLALAENLSTTRGANFYKVGDKFPQNAPLALILMATQSYLANGGGAGFSRKNKELQTSSREVKDGDHSSDDSRVSETEYTKSGTAISERKGSLSRKVEKKELLGIRLAAIDIAKRGRDSLASKNLTSFASVHLTTGIAMIAANLTPLAAELVSRPCDPDALDNRTPFDLIRNVLTLIEEDGSLVSPHQSSWDCKGKIIDETLVNAMREAAGAFRKCVEQDPENVDNWSWYVATLFGMLCVSYGAPPSEVLTVQTDVDVERKRTERRQLDSFHDIRGITSIALKDIINFSQSHDCPMLHLAIASMLEWKRAIFLLHRSQSFLKSFSGMNNELGMEVRTLHAHHTYHWALNVCSTTSIVKVQQLIESSFLPRDAFVDLLARAVERDPCERKNWARLVEALGTTRSTINGSTPCLYGNHVRSEERPSWRGKHRVVHWEDQFFRAPKSAAKAVKPEFVRMVSDIVEPLCRNVEQMEEFSLQERRTTMFQDSKDCMGWLWDPVEELSDMDHHRCAFTNGAWLPSNSPNITINSQSSLPFNSKNSKNLSGNPSCEALCLKIVVCSHLLGADHAFVSNSIWWLSVKLWQSTKTSDQLGSARNNYDVGLVWLVQYGLDVLVYLERRLKPEQQPAR